MFYLGTYSVTMPNITIIFKTPAVYFCHSAQVNHGNEEGLIWGTRAAG